MTDFYSQNRCVCSTRSHGPLLCAFCLSFHFKGPIGTCHYTDVFYINFVCVVNSSTTGVHNYACCTVSV